HLAGVRPAAAAGFPRQDGAYGRRRAAAGRPGPGRRHDVLGRPNQQRTMMTRLTRADLDGLPSYVPGRNLADLTRELGIAEAVKLASNEVPYGPLPGVPEAVAEAMRSSHRYPDMGVVELRDALADRFGVAGDRIVTGC